jgi:phosphoesterase RecJ-like protein
MRTKTRAKTPVTTADFKRAVSVVNDAQTFCVVAHRNPDGDALGSALAVMHLLQEHGKDATVSWPDPFEDSRDRYSFLPGINSAVPSSSVGKYDVVITCDCASLQRMGELREVFGNTAEQIVIDHHVSNEGFGTVNLIDVEAASTTVVVREFAHALGWPLTRDIAYCIYTGLITDTGRFQYANTNADVFALAHELAQFGIPIAELSRELFEQDRFAVIQLMAKVIERTQFDSELSFVWSYITDADLAEYGTKKTELEGFIELLRRTKEAEVSCLLRDYDGSIEGSLRAIEHVDVSAIAKSLGGGGHKLAAGFSSDQPMQSVIDDIKSQLRELSR